jgi:AraC family transcriptional regulator
MKLVWKDRGRPLTPDELRAGLAFVPAVSSLPLGWSGVRVEDIPALPAGEADQPPLSHLFLILGGRTPPRQPFVQCDDARYEAAEGFAGAVTVIPAGAASRFRWSGTVDCTHYYVSPGLVAKVADEACGLDPARLSWRALGCEPCPPVAATLSALRDELLSGGRGGRLCAESLANVLVVHLIRNLASGPAVRGMTGGLAKHALRAVVEYVMDNLAADLALADLAAVAHLSEFHFARLFKESTGQAPHQFLIERRVERAKELLAEGRLTLAEVAAAVGFSDQSHFTRHFKRRVGATPKRFA